MKQITKSPWSSSDLRKDLAASSPSGALQVAYLSSVTGASPRTQQSKNADTVSIRDFGAVGDGVADDTTAIQAAINSGATSLYWPSGVYKVTALTPRSNQAWFGAGKFATTVTWAQANIPNLNYNMVTSTGDITQFQVYDIGFRGSRPYQTSNSITGQDMACFWLRGGSNTDITIKHCLFEQFGDSTGAGGGGIFIGAISGTGKSIDNIVVSDCIFRENANVPGVYINAAGTYHTKASRISVHNNEFSVSITTADQNCIYVLGDSTLSVTNLSVVGNRFTISQPIDTCIELNWISGFHITHNAIIATGVGSCIPILVRDGSTVGTIAANQIQSTSTATGTSTALSLTRFSTGTNLQTHITITDNTIKGWGTGANGRAIDVGGGCAQIVISDNAIIGTSSSAKVSSGIVLGDGISNIMVSNNIFRDVMYVVVYGGASTNTMIDSNVMDRCGDGVTGMVVDSVTNQAITYAVVKDNVVSNVVAGTPNFVSVSPATATGNRVETNTLPAGLNHVNLSYASKQSAIILPAMTSGTTMAGTKYSFAQGSLSISTGQGFTIGGNLDAGSPNCALGDFVVPSCNVDLQGCTVNAYVSAANTIRIRVQNDTGGTVTIAAATWYVTVFKL